MSKTLTRTAARKATMARQKAARLASAMAHYRNGLTARAIAGEAIDPDFCRTLTLAFEAARETATETVNESPREAIDPREAINALMFDSQNGSGAYRAHRAQADAANAKRAAAIQAADDAALVSAFLADDATVLSAEMAAEDAANGCRACAKSAAYAAKRATGATVTVATVTYTEPSKPVRKCRDHA